MDSTFTARLALTVHLIGASIFVLPGSLGAQTLPSGWTVSDVGGPQIPGYATHSNGTFTVSGAGSGFRNTADSFTFVHRDLTGDGTLIARVGGMTNTHRWAAAGLMIRDTLSAGSRHAFVFATPSGEGGFVRRTVNGGSTTRTTLAAALPVWLKLERRTTTITASWSPDGVTWMTIGSDTVSMSAVVRVGLAVTSRAETSPAVATFSNVQVSALAQSGGPLPEGWSSMDIGSPAVAGRSTYDQATATVSVTGAGTGIDGTWDEFHLAYARVDGDLEVVARVGALGNTTVRSKAGVMIRDTLTPNGAHASVFATSGQGTLFQRRQAGGGTTATTVGSTAGTPLWIKLTVLSGVVTAYESVDGIAWAMLGTAALTLPSPYILGLAVSSHDPSATVSANVDQIAVRRPASPPNQPPTVSLTAPARGATFTAPAAVTIDASAADSDGTITGVDFYANSTLIGSDSTGPYSVTWSNVPAGTYSLTAIATDSTGASTVSTAVSVTVNATTNQPPQVTLSAPASGASFTAPATITISATASDVGEGGVSRVDFYAGSTIVGSDSSYPYSVTWSNVPAGSYSLTAVATDNMGASTTSSPRAITVTGVNAPPQIALTAPNDGATYTAPATVTISATATDSNGSVTKVDFYAGSTLLASDTSAPYSVTSSGMVAGTYTLTAVATDNAGATATSAPRTITVTSAPAPQQRWAVFSPSSDHSTLVNSYLVEIFAASANPATATPLASQDLGKPVPVNNEIRADVTAALSSLPPGTYQATVSAVGSGGSSRSAPFTFTR